MYGATIGSLSVLASASGSGPWSTVWTKSGAQGNSWSATVSVSVPPAGHYFKTGHYFKINGVRGTSHTGDIAVDDLQLVACTAAPTVAASTTNGTVLSAGVLLPSIPGVSAKMFTLIQAGKTVGAAASIAAAASAASDNSEEGDVVRVQQRAELMSLLTHGFAMSVGKLGHCPLIPWLDSGNVTKLSLTREVQLVGPLPKHVSDSSLSTFALFFNGYPTPLLPSNASATDVQTALEVLPGIGKLTVTRIATPEYDVNMVEEGYVRGGNLISWAWIVRFDEYMGDAPNIEASVWVDQATDNAPTCLYTPYDCTDFNHTRWAQDQAWAKGMTIDELMSSNLTNRTNMTPPCVAVRPNGTNTTSSTNNSSPTEYRKVVDVADHWSWWPTHRGARNLSEPGTAPVLQPNCTTAPARLRALNGTITGRYPARELVVGAARIALRCVVDKAEGGLQPLRVLSSTFGKAMSTDAMLAVSTRVHPSTQASELSQFGGKITLHGWGFSPVAERSNVLVGGQTCAITHSDFTMINCTTPGVQVVHVPANWSLWTPATVYNKHADTPAIGNSHWRINGSTLFQEALLHNDHVDGKVHVAAQAGFTAATVALTGRAHWRDYSVVATVRRDALPADKTHELCTRGNEMARSEVLITLGLSTSSNNPVKCVCSGYTLKAGENYLVPTRIYSNNSATQMPDSRGSYYGWQSDTSGTSAWFSLTHYPNHAQCGWRTRICATRRDESRGWSTFSWGTNPSGELRLNLRFYLPVITIKSCTVGMALRYSTGAYYALTEQATYGPEGTGFSEYHYNLYKVVQGEDVKHSTMLLAGASFNASLIDNSTTGLTAVTDYEHELVGSAVGGGEGFGPVQLSMHVNGVRVLVATDDIANEKPTVEDPLARVTVYDSASRMSSSTAASRKLRESTAQVKTSFEAGLVGLFTAGGATASFDNVVVTHGDINGTNGHTVESKVIAGVYDWEHSLTPAICSTSTGETLNDALCNAEHVVTPLRRRPELWSIFPHSGNALSASILTLTGRYFNDSDPSHNKITVGGELCPTISATATELRCQTPALVAGDHAVEVLVQVGLAELARGEGGGTEYVISSGRQVWAERAQVHRPPDCLFRQQLVIRATNGATAGPPITPRNGSFFGGSVLTLRGEGFSPIAGENRIALCGRQDVQCSMQSAGTGSGDGVGRGQGLLTCSTGAFFEFRQGTKASHSVTAPMSSSRDLLQASTCSAIIPSTLYPTKESMSFRPGSMQAMRFVKVPVPYAATVHRAVVNMTALHVSGDEMLTLSVRAELAGGSSQPMYGRIGSPLCERNWTDARVEWRVEPWEWADNEIVTVDLSTLVHEVVNQRGWKLGSAVLLLFEGLAAPMQQVLADGAQCSRYAYPITESWEDCYSAGVRLGYSGDSISQVDSYHADATAPQGCYKSGTNGRIQFNSDDGTSAEENAVGDKIICRTVPRNMQDFGLGERSARSFTGGIGAVGSPSSAGTDATATTVLPQVINLKVDYSPANLSAVLLRAEAEALEERNAAQAAADGMGIDEGALSSVSSDGVMACDVTVSVDAEVAPLIGSCASQAEDMAFEQPVVTTDAFFTGGLSYAEDNKFDATDNSKETSVILNDAGASGDDDDDERFDFNSPTTGEDISIASAQGESGVVDATEWKEVVHSVVVELRAHSRIARVSVEWAGDQAPSLGFTVEALANPDEILSGDRVAENMWKPLIADGERAFVGTKKVSVEPQGSCPSGFVENRDPARVGGSCPSGTRVCYRQCCRSCPVPYQCLLPLLSWTGGPSSCPSYQCSCVRPSGCSKGIGDCNHIAFGGGAYDIAVGAGGSVHATHVRIRSYSLQPVDTQGTCLANGEKTGCPSKFRHPPVIVALTSVRVFGCAIEPAAKATLRGGVYEYRLDKTPTLTSIFPLYGSTAGGTDVEVRGSGFGVAGMDADGRVDVAHVTVTMERGFPHPAKVECAVLSATDSVIHCVTGAVSLRDGGWSVVVVNIQGVGDAVAVGSGGDDGGVSFQYIDKWSSRTTWGGNNPPEPCNDWNDDRDCKNSVWVPQGNYVMLDRSPGRLYLLLIDGSLEFDPEGGDSMDRSIEIDATYILVKGGGTLRAGTEAAPFQHRATITLFGHVRSLELPIFGAKTLAIAGGTLALHGAPEYSKPAWTTLAMGHSALANSTTIRLSQPVLWPVGSYIVITSTAWPLPAKAAPTPAPGAQSWKASKGSSSAHEVASVRAVSADGLVLTLGAPLVHDHLSRIYHYPHSDLPLRMVSEVALLSRKIVVQGSGDSNECVAVSTPGKFSCSQFGGEYVMTDTLCTDTLIH
jgi:hypothetical protein